MAPQVNQISGASQVVRQGPREGPLLTAPDTGLDPCVSQGSPAFLQRDPPHLVWLSPEPLGLLRLWTRPSGPKGIWVALQAPPIGRGSRLWAQASSPGLGLGHLMGPGPCPDTIPLGPQGVALSIGTDLTVDVRASL